MASPFLPNLFPPTPPQLYFPPRGPNGGPWVPANFPPFPPDPSRSNGLYNPGGMIMPPNFRPGPPDMCHWRPPMSCDPVRPMGFQPRRGSKRGRGQWRDARMKSSVLFECKPCNKEYKTIENYNIHLQTHLKCGQCDFEGIGRALKDHELVHLLPDELKFTSDKDIQKWREERKKNFPTAENVARKKQLAEDKRQRGESATTPLHRYIQHVIGEDSDRRSSRGGRRGRGNRRGRGRPFNQRGYQQDRRNSKPEIQDTENKEKDDPNTRDNILGAIFADCDVLSTEAEGNSPEHDGDATKGKAPDSNPRKRDREVGECSRGKRQKWTSRRQNKKMKASSGLRAVTCGRQRPTLLEKLLAPEIRHEENALLQCIHHVVSNNFFVPQPSITEKSSDEQSGSCDPPAVSYDSTSRSGDDPLSSCDNPSRPCDSPKRRKYEHSSMILEPSPQSPDKPISSSEPPDRSFDIH